VVLFDAISNEGIKKICRKCSFEEDIPIIRKPTEFKLNKIEDRGKTVYERMTKVSGFDKRITIKEDEKVLGQNLELNKLIEKNILDATLNSKGMENLVDNFHWIIMRSRRARKITQEQFAKKISEPLALIKLAEKGVISERNSVLVKKIENDLGIRLLKGEEINSFEDEKEILKQELVKKVEDDELKFDEITKRTLTVSDLNELKDRKEESLFVPVEEPREDEPEFKIDFRDKKDLTEEEMNDIIFGRK